MRKINIPKQIKENRSYRTFRYVVYRETLVNPKEHLLTFIGAFLGIGLIGMSQQYLAEKQDVIYLIGSFGASAVLIYGIPKSPLAQMRNFIGGHLLSAFIGVLIQQLFPETLWLSAALSVSLSIVVMQMTKTLHPPGGATALIANIGSEKIKSLGFLYILYPVLSGILILGVVALLINKTRNSKLK